MSNKTHAATINPCPVVAVLVLHLCSGCGFASAMLKTFLRDCRLTWMEISTIVVLVQDSINLMMIEVVPLASGGVCSRGKVVVSGVDPPVGSSLPTSSIRGSSFTNLFKVTPIPGDYISGPLILLKKGGYVAVRVDPSAYKSRLEGFKYSLIGRVVLSSGKGYFQIMLNSDVDKNMVWSLGSLSLKPARRIGVPLRLDMATVEGDFKHFARVLVDIDVSIVPLSSLLLERDDSHSSFISVEYENLSAFCYTCSSFGHLPNAYRWNKSGKVIPVNSSKPDSTRDGPVTIVVDKGFQIPQNRASKLVYHLISGSSSHRFIGSEVSTIVGPFSLQRPPFPHTAHGVRNECSRSSQIYSSVTGSTKSFRLMASDSQAKLRLIAGSS
ncbi:hypothetical protein Ddye_010438 [Dipteronia dyeriana]|uniref:DUF4283 domain-containing protein n=1 Tax=Dipteronia dyeriana TaxID=168575 RepID=A0AAD9XDU6_9ROSI|nr:hypothetical protein Ddye_010433 [Dipteronia dyeriana]KAK2657386.1 hypothetical protein Ddye_010438 [Dipteronia dyeriana]